MFHLVMVVLFGWFAAAAVAQGNSPPPATLPATASTSADEAEEDCECDDEEEIEFLRLIEQTPNPRLEAAEVTFKNAAGASVRLVAAVHIGEQAYYQSLQEGFERDDAVLYEMVKPRGAPPPRRGQHGDHAVTQLQQMLKSKMDLAYQLDEIDYHRPNFVHADLDAETFRRLQRQRNESMASLMLRAITDSTAPQAGGDSAAQLMTLIAAPDPERQMRLMMARGIEHMESVVMGLEGPDGTVILSERNKQAIAVLERQLQRGKKRISIFYGAAHMPDLANRVQELGFEPTETRWVTAWELGVRRNRPSMLQKWFGQPAKRPTSKPTTVPVAGRP